MSSETNKTSYKKSLYDELLKIQVKDKDLKFKINNNNDDYNQFKENIENFLTQNIQIISNDSIKNVIQKYDYLILKKSIYTDLNESLKKTYDEIDTFIKDITTLFTNIFNKDILLYKNKNTFNSDLNETKLNKSDYEDIFTKIMVLYKAYPILKENNELQINQIDTIWKNTCIKMKENILTNIFNFYLNSIINEYGSKENGTLSKLKIPNTFDNLEETSQTFISLKESINIIESYIFKINSFFTINKNSIVPNGNENNFKINITSQGANTNTYIKNLFKEIEDLKTKINDFKKNLQEGIKKFRVKTLNEKKSLYTDFINLYNDAIKTLKNCIDLVKINDSVDIEKILNTLLNMKKLLDSGNPFLLNAITKININGSVENIKSGKIQLINIITKIKESFSNLEYISNNNIRSKIESNNQLFNEENIKKIKLVKNNINSKFRNIKVESYRNAKTMSNTNKQTKIANQEKKLLEQAAKLLEEETKLRKEQNNADKAKAEAQRLDNEAKEVQRKANEAKKLDNEAKEAQKKANEANEAQRKANETKKLDNEAKANEAKANEAKANEAKANEAKANEAKEAQRKVNEANEAQRKANEAKRLDNEAKANEAKRLDNEAKETQRKANEAKRLDNEAKAKEDQRKANEAKRLDNEAKEAQRKANDAKRLENEAKAKEAQRKANEDKEAQRKANEAKEAKRLDNEAKEAQRKANDAKRLENEAKAKEAQRKANEAKRLDNEAKAKEAQRLANESKIKKINSSQSLCNIPKNFKSHQNYMTMNSAIKDNRSKSTENRLNCRVELLKKLGTSYKKGTISKLSNNKEQARKTLSTYRQIANSKFTPQMKKEINNTWVI
jgi:hypothetical protein